MLLTEIPAKPCSSVLPTKVGDHTVQHWLTWALPEGPAIAGSNMLMAEVFPQPALSGGAHLLQLVLMPPSSTSGSFHVSQGGSLVHLTYSLFLLLPALATLCWVKASAPMNLTAQSGPCDRHQSLPTNGNHSPLLTGLGSWQDTSSDIAIKVHGTKTLLSILWGYSIPWGLFDLHISDLRGFFLSLKRNNCSVFLSLFGVIIRSLPPLKLASCCWVHWTYYYFSTGLSVSNYFVLMLCEYVESVPPSISATCWVCCRHSTPKHFSGISCYYLPLYFWSYCFWVHVKAVFHWVYRSEGQKDRKHTGMQGHLEVPFISGGYDWWHPVGFVALSLLEISDSFAAVRVMETDGAEKEHLCMLIISSLCGGAAALATAV